MIEASFDKLSKRAAIDGVFQYDTGQRLRLSGLPSPGEMSAADEFLSGDLAPVLVQFGHEGDSQTESRLAEWDEAKNAWLCALPDEYLTRAEPVNVYVYVMHGADDNGSRNKTMYTGVFTPIGRPAPNDTATEDQLRTWETLEAEVDLAVASVNTAEQNAANEVDRTNEAAEAAHKAAEAAENASRNADDALFNIEQIGELWGGMRAVATALPEGAQATAALNGNMLTLGIPRGATGPEGAPGADGPSDIELSMADGVLTITPK